MATYASPVLAGVTLPDVEWPDGYSTATEFRGGRTQLASGTYRYDILKQNSPAALKRTWRLAWNYLSMAQKTIVETAFEQLLEGGANFIPPDEAVSYDCHLGNQDSLQFTAWRDAGGNVYYKTQLILRQDS